MTRIVLADDHPVVLDGLEQVFRLETDLQIVGRATSALAALKAVEHHRPDVLVLDFVFPDHDALWVLERLPGLRAPTRVVILTAFADDSRLQAAMRMGARGIVLKEMAPRVLVDCVRAVHAGAVWGPGEAGTPLPGPMDLADEGTLLQALTTREVEVAGLVALGLRNRDIAERLSISEGTVKIHLHNIYQKLGIDGRSQLVRVAARHGLI
jgi:two-component system nitrate/nitrite response regulator NarL